MATCDGEVNHFMSSSLRKCLCQGAKNYLHRSYETSPHPWLLALLHHALTGTAVSVWFIAHRYHSVKCLLLPTNLLSITMLVLVKASPLLTFSQLQIPRIPVLQTVYTLYKATDVVGASRMLGS